MKNQMTKQLITATVALGFAASLVGYGAQSTTHNQKSNTLTAREIQPGDDRGKDKKDIDSGKHRVAEQVLVAREKEPGDDRGKDKKDIDSGKHRVADQILVAREKEPGDDRGKDPAPHKFAENTLAQLA